MSDHITISVTLTPWLVVLFALSWCVAAFTRGFVAAFIRELKEPDDQFQRDASRRARP